MRANITILLILGAFFALLTAVYTLWNLAVFGAVEWVGTVAFAFMVALCALIGFFLVRSLRAQHGALPEDRATADIEDGDPEIGFFSPYSWWPLALAATAGVGFLGLAIGPWLAVIAAPLLAVALVGWVSEYSGTSHGR